MMLLDQFSSIVGERTAGDAAGSVQQHQQHGRFLALPLGLMLLGRNSSIKNRLSLMMLLLFRFSGTSSTSSIDQREQ